MKFTTSIHIERVHWSKIYDKNNYATPFQSPEYFDFINSIPNSSAEVFIVTDEEEIKVLCVVTCQKEAGIKGYFSRRAIIYGGPLLVRNDQSYFEYLLTGIEKYYRQKAIYIEFRPLYDYHSFDRIFQLRKWEYLPYQNYIIQLTNEKEVFSKIKYEKRRQIRKSLKSGSKVQILSSPSDTIIKELFQLFEKLYKNKINKPVPSICFFKNLSQAKFCKVLIITYNDIIIGGSFLLFNSNIIYDWYRVGDDVNYRNQYPSTLAAWGAIKAGIEMGCKTFDFMGAGRKDRDYGVREFKSRFGGELVEYGRYIKIIHPLLYQIGKTGLSFMKLFSR